LVPDVFLFQWSICSVTQGAFVYGRAGVKIAIHNNEAQTTIFTRFQERSAFSLFDSAKQNICPMAERALVGSCFRFGILVDQNQTEAAFFTVNEHGTFTAFHFAAPLGVQG
jgi:hypothetical protein